MKKIVAREFLYILGVSIVFFGGWFIYQMMHDFNRSKIYSNDSDLIELERIDSLTPFKLKLYLVFDRNHALPKSMNSQTFILNLDQDEVFREDCRKFILSNMTNMTPLLFDLYEKRNIDHSYDYILGLVKKYEGDSRKMLKEFGWKIRGSHYSNKAIDELLDLYDTFEIRSKCSDSEVFDKLIRNDSSSYKISKRIDLLNQENTELKNSRWHPEVNYDILRDMLGLLLFVVFFLRYLSNMTRWSISQLRK